MNNAVKEIQSFVSFVQGIQNDPDIAPLIDAKKIVLVPRFSTALDAAISHYLTHGDHTLLARIVALISVTKQQNAVLAYAFERTHLSHGWENGELKFKRNKCTQGDEQYIRSLSEHLKIAGKSVPNIAVPNTKNFKEGPAKKPLKKLKYIDALDSRSRLPGSFEGGGRR